MYESLEGERYELNVLDSQTDELIYTLIAETQDSLQEQLHKVDSAIEKFRASELINDWES